MKRNVHGLTLVEILVVLGIVAVLIALLLPVVSRVRESAKRTACMSNLREIASFLHLYFNDHKNRLPVVNPYPWIAPAPGESKESIVEALGPYTKGATKVWQCPADRLINGNFATSLGVSPKAQTYHELFETSYEYNPILNIFIGDEVHTSVFRRFTRESAVSLSQFWVFHEYAPFHGRPGAPGASNYLFADWHVGDLK